MFVGGPINAYAFPAGGLDLVIESQLTVAADVQGSSARSDGKRCSTRRAEGARVRGAGDGGDEVGTGHRGRLLEREDLLE